MKIFVVRLNPDIRDGNPYSKYPTIKEYKTIHESSPMDGFHEAVNFLPEDGVIRGYLPPKHLCSMRTGAPFVLITITAKTAKVGGDMLVGLQAGCKYEGENTRLESRALKFNWHYSCRESMSLLLTNQIPNARKLILGQNNSWVRGPTYEIKKATFQKILKSIEKSSLESKEEQKYNKILQYLNNPIEQNKSQIIVESDFDLQVSDALEHDLLKVIGNQSPKQLEVRSFQYQRDPAIVAYALKKADGVCSDCKKPAPFISRKTGLPYLEVHHIKTLKDGGSDTIDNVIALCPNCHRKRHHGEATLQTRKMR
jgi:predicted HNH restriction endonuclease